MRRHQLLLFAFLGTVAFPVQALANAGTPLMWAGMFHLSIGNAVIGVLEGLLVAQLFGAPKGRAIGVMIAANYVSAWVGGLFLREAIVAALPLDLNNGWYQLAPQEATHSTKDTAPPSETVHFD